MVQKTANVEVKTGLKSNIMVQDLDIRCFRGHCFSNNTALKVQTQETTNKNPGRKKPKAKKTKLAYVEIVELSEQNKKDKKKKTKERRRNTTGEQKKLILATGNNIIDASRKKNQYDISKITYFNQDKKSHYTSTYITSLKNKYWF